MSSKDIQITFAGNVKKAHRDAVEQYIRNLEEQHLPVVLSVSHFSLLTNVKESELYAISNSPDAFYKNFRVRKKSGGHRSISAPLPLLLYVQRWVLHNVLEKIEVHPAAKAYKKKSSIRENAKFHRRQKALFKSDVANFFGSISEFWVSNFFFRLGYSQAVAVFLSKICCKDGSLPQGAATSGYLSNIILRDFDTDLFTFARERKLRYTRYADDIAISGESLNFDELKCLVAQSLKSIGLNINWSKTRLLRPHNRQKVTGVIVNERLGPSRDFLRSLRQDIYFIDKFGIYGHARHVGASSPLSCLNNLIGRISHAIFLLGGDEKLENAKANLEKILRDF